MEIRDSSESFGCNACWPAEADAAWEGRRSLAGAAELVDESHYHVMVLACPQCLQRFLSVFTETIDWAEGEDPQYWTTLPITADEFANLALQTPPSEASIGAIGAGRACLRRDFPKHGTPRAYWSTGIQVGPHD